jgi:hypothetical protein
MVDNWERTPGPFGPPAEEELPMRRTILLLALLMAGCHNVNGPFEHRTPARVDDPSLSIGEQEREGRARLALPVESRAVGPNSGVEIPGPTPR